MSNKILNKEYSSINIKVDNKEQIISKFSYDETDKLNADLSTFIVDKTKLLPINQQIELNIHSSQNLDIVEVSNTIRKHFKAEYLDCKNELRYLNIFTFIMLIMGIISISILLLSYKFFNNLYMEIILEIISWVFVWEAVDTFFLTRNKLRRQAKLMLNISNAKINVTIKK